MLKTTDGWYSTTTCTRTIRTHLSKIFAALVKPVTYVYTCTVHSKLHTYSTCTAVHVLPEVVNSLSTYIVLHTFVRRYFVSTVRVHMCKLCVSCNLRVKLHLSIRYESTFVPRYFRTMYEGAEVTTY